LRRIRTNDKSFIRDGDDESFESQLNEILFARRDFIRFVENLNSRQRLDCSDVNAYALARFQTFFHVL